MTRCHSRKPTPSPYVELSYFRDDKLAQVYAQLAAGSSIEGVARHFRVDPDKLQRWWNQQRGVGI